MLQPFSTALPCTLNFNVAWNNAWNCNNCHAMQSFFCWSALWPWSWCCERRINATLKFGVQGAGSCQGLQHFFLYQYSAKGQTTLKFGVQGAGSRERKIRNAHHQPTLHCKVCSKVELWMQGAGSREEKNAMRIISQLLITTSTLFITTSGSTLELSLPF